MNPNWDLSYLYKGFDDPAFLADLKRFPEEIKVEQAILDGGDDPQTSWRSSPTSRRFLVRCPTGSRRSAA